MRTARVLDGLMYAPGARFRVAAERLKLTGWTPMRGGSRGWGRELHPGDILTCTGFGPGMGADPGFGVEFTSEESTAAGAFHCEIWPSAGGIWDSRPPSGSLEPAD